ncbi:MAG: hypothetical protein IJH12_07520 [Clostridia bacterium]|nr:hypothetical protein [Clostridia bacterium]
MENCSDKFENERKSRIKIITEKLSKAFKSLWVGEHIATGNVSAEPVNEADSRKFEAVIEGIHEREKSYKDAMKADGRLKEVNRRREEKNEQSVELNEVKQKDRADY